MSSTASRAPQRQHSESKGQPPTQSRHQHAAPGIPLPCGSGAKSLAEGSPTALVLQDLGKDFDFGALNRTIRQLLDRDEIDYTLLETPNSRLQKYRLFDQPQAGK